MKHAILAVAAAFVLGVVSVVSTVPSSAFSQTAASEAAVQTAIFNVDNMTCALCGIIVKTALQGVEGVRSVEIDFGAKTATVVFDPSVTTTEAIATASTNAGYPATAGS